MSEPVPIRCTKGPGKCVRLYRMSKNTGVRLHTSSTVLTFYGGYPIKVWGGGRIFIFRSGVMSYCFCVLEMIEV